MNNINDDKIDQLLSDEFNLLNKTPIKEPTPVSIPSPIIKSNLIEEDIIVKEDSIPLGPKSTPNVKKDDAIIQEDTIMKNVCIPLLDDNLPETKDSIDVKTSDPIVDSSPLETSHNNIRESSPVLTAEILLPEELPTLSPVSDVETPTLISTTDDHQGTPIPSLPVLTTSDIDGIVNLDEDDMLALDLENMNFEVDDEGVCFHRRINKYMSKE